MLKQYLSKCIISLCIITLIIMNIIKTLRFNDVLEHYLPLYIQIPSYIAVVVGIAGVIFTVVYRHEIEITPSDIYLSYPVLALEIIELGLSFFGLQDDPLELVIYLGVVILLLPLLNTKFIDKYKQIID